MNKFIIERLCFFIYEKKKWYHVRCELPEEFEEYILDFMKDIGCGNVRRVKSRKGYIYFQAGGYHLLREKVIPFINKNIKKDMVNFEKYINWRENILAIKPKRNAKIRKPIFE